jgi:KaiC/GvpD/RAD55 family RecA-like ATPase
MQELASPTTSTSIQSFEDIPDIQTLEVPEPEYIVPSLGIARNTITLWTGPDGHGKTILAQNMAIAVAHGRNFLDL